MSTAWKQTGTGIGVATKGNNTTQGRESGCAAETEVSPPAHGTRLLLLDLQGFSSKVEDVSRGVRWVFQNIERYGGDTSQILLMGQSAGAHLAAMLLLEHSLLEAKHLAKGGQDEADNWSVKDLKGFLGISGPYHLQKLGPHLASRGLYPGIMNHMTGGDLLGCSPEALLQQDDWKALGDKAVNLLPRIHLFHGDRDSWTCL